jgi:hypothetical protein
MRAIGSEMYVVRAESRELFRPCPVCNGDKRVTLILGSGEHVSIDCDFCKAGWLGPTGTEKYYEWSAEVVRCVVSGLEARDGAVRYYTDAPSGGRYVYDASQTYDSHDEAMVACGVAIAEREAEQTERMGRKVKANKSYSWHVGYHRREAAEHRRKMEYHAAAAVVVQAKSREGVTP